jgi:hypothetical protein
MRNDDETSGRTGTRMVRPQDVAEARSALEAAMERLQTRPGEALWLLADAGALIADRLLPDGERARLLDLELATGCGFRSRPGADQVGRLRLERGPAGIGPPPP